jgi:hypothetical protein
MPAVRDRMCEPVYPAMVTGPNRLAITVAIEPSLVSNEELVLDGSWISTSNIAVDRER